MILVRTKIGQGRCEQRSEVFVKIQNKMGGGGGGGGGVRLGGGGQDGCEQRIEVFVKIHFFFFFFFGGGGGWGWGVGLGGQGRCEQRSDFENSKKKLEGGWGQVGGGGGSGWV